MLLNLEMTDPDGHPLVPIKGRDVFRHKAVWAVYKIHTGHSRAAARSSDFVTLTAAKTVADTLNAGRNSGARYYFKVCRPTLPALLGVEDDSEVA